MAKYIFVTGGVVSGLGKGLTAASLGRILKQRGQKVFMHNGKIGRITLEFPPVEEETAHEDHPGD